MITTFLEINVPAVFNYHHSNAFFVIGYGDVNNILVTIV